MAGMIASECFAARTVCRRALIGQACYIDLLRAGALV